MLLVEAGELGPAPVELAIEDGALGRARVLLEEEDRALVVGERGEGGRVETGGAARRWRGGARPGGRAVLLGAKLVDLAGKPGAAQLDDRLSGLDEVALGGGEALDDAALEMLDEDVDAVGDDLAGRDGALRQRRPGGPEHEAREHDAAQQRDGERDAGAGPTPRASPRAR